MIDREHTQERSELMRALRHIVSVRRPCGDHEGRELHTAGGIEPMTEETCMWCRARAVLAKYEKERE